MSTTTTPNQPVSPMPSSQLIAGRPTYSNRPTYADRTSYVDPTSYVDATTYVDDTRSGDRVATYPGEPVEATRPAAKTGIDSRRFWVGTALTAGITALVALIALIVAHDLLRVPMLVHEGGRLITVGFGAYILLAAALAVAASVIYHVILRFAPRPRLYYSWLAILGTLLAVLLPLTAGAAFIDQVTLAAINLVVGLVITGLVPVAAVKLR